MQDFNYTSLKQILGDQNFLTAVNYTVGEMIASLCLTFIFAIGIYFLYKKTYQGVTFSRNFGLTIILVSMISSVIVMAISGNLALSLGMIGALSIVRFRSAIKDPRDIAYLFWAVSNGIVAGVFIYKLAIIANLLIAAIILVFHKRVVRDGAYILIIRGKNIVRETLFQTLEQHCSYVALRLTHAQTSGEELHVEVRPKKQKDGAQHIDQMIQKVTKQEGVEKVSAVSYEGELGSV